MKQDDLVNAIVAMEPGGVEATIKLAFDVISQQLANNETVVIADFGAFEVKAGEASDDQPPETGHPIEIPAKPVVIFKPSNALEEIIRGGRTCCLPMGDGLTDE